MSNALQRDLLRMAARVEREDGPKAAQDPHRLTFHIQPPTGWLNDPNGLCKYGEDYHVFFQYGPFDCTGGVKHWGHCKSRDLVHWEYLPILLCPDQPYDIHGVYSGSAYIEDGKMYLYYTGNVKHEGDHDYIRTGRGHNTCLAISEDGESMASKQCLMENKDYPAGLTCHVRDPKVWKMDGKYYMVQGARTLEDRGEVLIFQSEDKMHWTHCNTITTPEIFGYMWECPDLFEIDGQWFLCVSPQGVAQTDDRFQNVYACGYFPLYGDFRGDCTLGEFQTLDKGFDFYAPQSFLDGTRRIQFGWMGMPDAEYTNPTTAYGWQHCMTVPCVLTAKDGKILRNPVSELNALHGTVRHLSVAPGVSESVKTFDLQYQTAGQPFDLTIHDSVRLNWQDGVLILSVPQGGAGRTTRVAHCAAPMSLRILADTSSVEVFVDGGATCMSTRCYPTSWGVRWTSGTGDAQLWDMKQA